VKGFSLEQAVRDGFYFCSSVGRRSKPLWLLFFVAWGLLLIQTFMTEAVVGIFFETFGFETAAETLASQPTWIAQLNPTIVGLFLFVTMVLVLLVHMVLQKAAMLSHRFSGEEIQPDYFKVPGNVILNYLWLLLIFNLVVFAGTLLLIIPGVVLSVTYVFAPYMLLDKQKGTMLSFRLSSQLIDGVRWKYFLCELLVSVIAIILVLAATQPFEIFLGSGSMFVPLWSNFLSAFLVFFLIFFRASIYRQLVESIKYNPVMEPEFVKNYFVVRYRDEEADANENNIELPARTEAD
jgi:hypothetical protein